MDTLSHFRKRQKSFFKLCCVFSTGKRVDPYAIMLEKTDFLKSLIGGCFGFGHAPWHSADKPRATWGLGALHFFFFFLENRPKIALNKC